MCASVFNTSKTYRCLCSCYLTFSLATAAQILDTVGFLTESHMIHRSHENPHPWWSSISATTHKLQPARGNEKPASETHKWWWMDQNHLNLQLTQIAGFNPQHWLSTHKLNPASGIWSFFVTHEKRMFWVASCGSRIPQPRHDCRYGQVQWSPPVTSYMAPHRSSR
jgi:hypothetical protein